MKKGSLGFATQAIHSGAVTPSTHGQAIGTPIVQTSSFAFESVEAMEATITQPGLGFVYTRVNNPTIDAMERVVAELEQGEASVAFASGMAAIHAAVLACMTSGEHMIAPASLYGGAYNLFTGLFAELGLQTTFAEDLSLETLDSCIKDNTKLLYLETIGNPLMRVPDLPKLIRWAQARGLKVIVDSTFATAYLSRPLEYGADLVLHSASKYLGGHGDLIGGITVGKGALINQVRSHAINAGGVMAPLTAWLVLRGIKTLPLRMKQHCHNALEVARFLAQHPQVQAVHYPGLESHPDHALARECLENGFGAVVSLELSGTKERATGFCNTLERFQRAGSLGDTHSLVLQPAMASHRGLSEEALTKAGISPGFVRLSIGLEDAQDLVDDLRQALYQLPA